ncbi:MAG: hypothetical protein GY744_05435 [Gammaproteobacteria bacterium]|nr:hypothetical protein [Gammaproteobacteria bacterium]
MSFYYIYKITQLPGNVIKKLEKAGQFEKYKDAKKQVSALRNEQPADESVLYKIIFADSELNAEQTLQEKREEQIIREWEK